MYAMNAAKPVLMEFPAFAILLVLASAPHVVGQESPKESSCHPIGNYRFVRESVERAKDVARTQSLLDTLSCIARTNRSGNSLNMAAVRAGFVIGGRDEAISRFLLSVIQDTETPLTAQRVACDLIKYVADPDAEAAMFQTFKDRWPSPNFPTFIEFFVAMGNTDFLAWADEQLKLDAQSASLMRWVKGQAELIRVQQDPQKVLQYITSPEHPIFYRTTLTRYAHRCGVTRAELRNAFLPLFQKKVPTEKESSDQVELLGALDELRVFGEEDEGMLKRASRIHGSSMSYAEWVPRGFEEVMAKKRAKFLRVTDN